MKNKYLVHSLVALVMASGHLAMARADNPPVVREVGGVSYVSGGVGVESLQQLSDRLSEFNVKLVFALNSGEYLNDVAVVIFDAEGRTRVEARSEGPWFLIKLPTGHFRVVARHGGKAQEKAITVDGAALRTVDFRWRDGDE